MKNIIKKSINMKSVLCLLMAWDHHGLGYKQNQLSTVPFTFGYLCLQCFLYPKLRRIVLIVWWHGCWWLGTTMKQDINIHRIDIFLLKNTCLRTQRVKTSYHIHGSHRPWKVLEFECCLEKCLIFQSALKIGNFPWKVLENDFMVLKNIGTR